MVPGCDPNQPAAAESWASWGSRGAHQDPSLVASAIMHDAHGLPHRALPIGRPMECMVCIKQPAASA